MKSSSLRTVPAIAFRQFGGPEVLEIVEVPLRPATGTQVLVHVRAAAVNPTDTLMRRGQATIRELDGNGRPSVPGMDFAGVVDAVGDETMWSVGDRVAGMTMPGRDPLAGAYASRVLVPGESLTRLPAGTDFVSASTLVMNGLTALRALDALSLDSGDAIGVTGGVGAVGGYAIQLAKKRGVRVIADASTADRDLVHGLGADLVVERGPGVAERFVTAADGPVDAIIDAALIGSALLPAIKDHGQFAAVRPVDWEPTRGIVLHRVVVYDYAREQSKLDELRMYVEQGDLSLRVARTFAPEQAAEAHRVLEAGGTRGRLVITWPAE